MRDYSKISPSVWHSGRFNNLPSDDGRYLYLYLLTSTHQTSAGCYQLPDGYACTDLRWPPERYKKARQQLVEADLIGFDADANVVMIKRWFKHNPPMSVSHLKGIERTLERLPSDALRDAVGKDLQASWEAVLTQKAAETLQKQKAASGAPSSLSDRLNTPHMKAGH